MTRGEIIKANTSVLAGIQKQAGGNLAEALGLQPETFASPAVDALIDIIAKEVAIAKFVITQNGRPVDVNFTLKAEGINSDYEWKQRLVRELLKHGRVLVVIANNAYIFYDYTRNVRNGKLVSYTVNGKNFSQDFAFEIVSNDGLKVLKPYIDIENALVKFLQHYFGSNGLFGIGYMDASIQYDDEVKRDIEQLIVIAKNTLKKGDVPVLPSVLKIDTKQATLEFVTSIRDTLIEEYARHFNIPLTIAQSLKGRGSYALAKEERKYFYESCISRYHELLKAGFSEFFKNRGASFEIDLSGYVYLQEAKEWTTAEVLQLYSVGLVERDEARGLLGLEKVMRKTVVKSIEEEDAKLWQALKGVDAVERQLKADMLSDVSKYARRLAVWYIEAKKDEGEAPEDIIRKLNTQLVTNLRRAAKRTVERSWDAFATSGVYINRPKVLEAVLDEYERRLQTGIIISNISERILAFLKNLAAREDKWTTDELAIAIAQSGLTDGEAWRIARTEVGHVQNHVSLHQAVDLQEQGRKLLKRWSCSLDEKVRTSHLEAALEGWKEWDEPFSNGLMMPHDDNADVSEVVNCRCALLYKIEEE